VRARARDGVDVGDLLGVHRLVEARADREVGDRQALVVAAVAGGEHGQGHQRGHERGRRGEARPWRAAETSEEHQGRQSDRPVAPAPDGHS
jgi:hypothetical protein